MGVILRHPVKNQQSQLFNKNQGSNLAHTRCLYHCDTLRLFIFQPRANWIGRQGTRLCLITDNRIYVPTAAVLIWGKKTHYFYILELTDIVSFQSPSKKSIYEAQFFDNVHTDYIKLLILYVLMKVS